MPSYDFKCRDCDSTATLMTGIKENLNIPICISCKQEMVRSYGVLSVKFKGEGFASNERK